MADRNMIQTPSKGRIVLYQSASMLEEAIIYLTYR